MKRTCLKNTNKKTLIFNYMAFHHTLKNERLSPLYKVFFWAKISKIKYTAYLLRSSETI